MEKQEQWQKVKEIVGAALDRQPRERTAFLDEACAHDGKLRAEVESLLAAHAEAAAAGKGVVLVDGRLIETLHVENARRLVALAEEIDRLSIAG